MEEISLEEEPPSETRETALNNKSAALETSGDSNRDSNNGSTLNPVHHSNLNCNSNMQHDLEKLQEAHDKLMAELDEKRTFAEKLHLQLDRAIDDNDGLREQIEELTCDLKKATSQIEEKDKRLNDLAESETRFNKMKALAVKLKRELAEARAENELKATATSSEGKEQTKQIAKENERITNLYQHSVRNFQNLQSEYDNLQDEFDKLVASKKSADSDLTGSVSELSKVREELAESRHEGDNLKKRLSNLEQTIEGGVGRRKELESKIILLTSELESERKQLVNQTGLNQLVAELRSQLDARTSELVELTELVDKQRGFEVDSKQLDERLKSLKSDYDQLVERHEEVINENNQLKKQLEECNSSNEDNQIKIIELVNENKNLESSISKNKENATSRIKELESKWRDVKSQLELNEDELVQKNEEFESYKIRVTKVLNDKTSSSNVEKERERLIALEEEFAETKSELNSVQQQLASEVAVREQLELDLNSSRNEVSTIKEQFASELSSTKKENESLKSLSRDLQVKLVSIRNQLEKQLADCQEQFAIKERDLNLRIDNLVTEVDEEKQKVRSKNFLELSVSETTTVVGGDQQSVNPVQQISPSNQSDFEIESIGSTSITESRVKRLSISSASALNQQMNVLEEILNAKTPMVSKSGSETGDEQLNQPTTRRQMNIVELLEESESANMLLSEQNRVLKEEIRRLERTISRTELAQNLEYLKNILIKFLTLESGSSEKLQLVPVLRTVLKLSKEEENFLMLAASTVSSEQQSVNPVVGEDSNVQGANNWTSYLWG